MRIPVFFKIGSSFAQIFFKTTLKSILSHFANFLEPFYLWQSFRALNGDERKTDTKAAVFLGQLLGHPDRAAWGASWDVTPQTPY